MAKTSKTKSIDITKTGPMTGKQLQDINNSALSPGISPEFMQFGQDIKSLSTPTSLYDASVHAQQDVMSSLASGTTRTGGQDYWGRSHFDQPTATEEQFRSLSDIRAENQPWYSKILNGIGKAGVLAGTTALETAGLLYGAGHSVLETAGVLEDNGKSWLQDLWDNPITNALQSINEASEDLMPNYYTQDEMENPFGNIFTANFLGDKLLKNFGFMVGAFYGGIPASSLIGKIGTRAVKRARNAALAEGTGIAERFAGLTEGYADDVLGRAGEYGRKVAGLSDEAAAEIGASYGDEVTGLYRKLAKEGLTEGEKGRKMLDALDRINRVAQTTRATTQTLGALGSAINEGAIEALNNSKDWAEAQKKVAEDEYQQQLAAIEQEYGGTEVENRLKMELSEQYADKLAAIEKGRASMGNVDMLLNLPILLYSNMYQLGRLYSRGFDSTRRQLGSLWNGHSLSGSLLKGTLKSDRTKTKALLSAISKSNTEGLEEFLQRSASDGAGEAVNKSIERSLDAGNSQDATASVDDFLAGFSKAIADNLGNPQAWEEYVIGFLSSMVGMPVFGSQTKNSYIAKDNGVFGFAGGIVGNYRDYMAAKEQEDKVAEYLNQHVGDYIGANKAGYGSGVADYLRKRVNDPKFKALYKNLRVESDYDKWLKDAVEENDKAGYKDLEVEEFYQFLNAAASSGHLEEFKQLVGYNQDYTDEELEDIVKQTTRTITAEQQKRQDESLKAELEGAIERASEDNEDALVQDYQEELEEVNRRLEEDKYENKLEGPFIDVNGQMNVTNPTKMREILERNRQNLLQGIDDYLKIRNDIDIETDGRLDDSHIETLTMLRGHILDYEKRSTEMTLDILGHLGDVSSYVGTWREKEAARVERAQNKYNEVKEHWNKVKAGSHSKDWKEKVEKEYLKADEALKKAKASMSAAENAIKFLESLQEQKETTASERAARSKGQGAGRLGRLASRLGLLEDEDTRGLNSDELENWLTNAKNTDELSSNVSALAGLIMMTPGLDNSIKMRLIEEVADLGLAGNRKLEYRRKVREYLGDIEKLNEAYRDHENAVSKRELDNKSDELSLNIKNARNMAELDRIMNDAYNVNSEVAKSAMEKAKQTADESTKNFIADYEKAVKFRGEIMSQVQKFSPDIAANLAGSIAEEWEHALQNSTNLYDEFVEGLNIAADTLEKEADNPRANATGKTMKQLLKDLDAAQRGLATNKTVKKKAANSSGEDTSESTPGESAALKALSEQRKKRSAESSKEKKEEKPAEDTPDSLRKAAEAEVRANNKIDDESKLSEALKNRIQKYNDGHKDAPFTFDFNSLFQKMADERIAADNTNLGTADLGTDGTDIGEDSEGSQRAQDMKNNLKVTFRSDHPTEYRTHDGGALLERRVPYSPETEQMVAVQKLLRDLKAYQFIDKNYLGYVYQALLSAEKPRTVHLLRSTDDTINSDKTHPITFLAIEWDSDAEKAVRDRAFNGRKSVDLTSNGQEVHPVTIDGVQYQIIGVLSLNSEVAKEVSDAFSSLQGALNKELNPQIEDAKAQGKPFVVSDKITTISNVYTGRLDKKNTEDDDRNNVGLLIFMTSNQESSENPSTHDRRISTEWANGMEFYFGVVVNEFLNAVEDDVIRENWEEPNPDWMKKNNGAIVLFLPKADGKLYPVRCVRRTVGDWWEDIQDAEGGKSGKELIKMLLDPNSKYKNEYLGNILKYLKDIYDDAVPLSEKMNAKMMLQKYFILGKESPIHFNGDSITLTFGKDSEDITRDSFEEFVEAFFEAFEARNVMFTLPAPSIEEVDGRDVIKSGIFEINLRGFYNFNANFTLNPIDGNGNGINDIPEQGGNSALDDGGNTRANKINFDLGDGMKSYTLEDDGTITLNGEPLPNDVQNVISQALQAETGNIPEFKAERLGSKYDTSPAVKKYVADGLGDFFSKVYIIHDEEDWIYDGRDVNHDNRLYKLSSEKGQELMEDFEKGLKAFLTKSEHVLAISKLQNAAKTNPSTGTGTVQESKEDIEAALRSIGQQMKNAMEKSGDVEELESLYELGKEAIARAEAAGVKGIVGNIKGIHKLLGVKLNKLKKVQEAQQASSSNAPKASSAEEQQAGRQFMGKTLDDMDMLAGGLEGFLAANVKNPIVKKVFKALQNAEEVSKAIDQNDVLNRIKAIIEAAKKKDKELRDSLLNSLIHDITCG